MPMIHFLNVKSGDCSIIEHISKHVTVIDVCNAKTPDVYAESAAKVAAGQERGLTGNFNQKDYPVNPITYMRERGIDNVFRFILTHPDCDHLDGIKEFFETFSPANFWDTDNDAEKEFGDDYYAYNEDDWKFYKKLRTEKPTSDPKRLTLLSGSRGQYFNKGENNEGGGDGLHILSPTKELVASGCESGDYNDCSYAILYKTGDLRILFAGDTHDASWDHILKNHKADVTNVDLLIAPHHGRDSDRDWSFLDTLNPGLTLFGNASSEHLAYSAFSSRGLRIITNNQAGNIISQIVDNAIHVYVTHKNYAVHSTVGTFYADAFDAYYWGTINPRKETTSAS
jgi:competence protein ComEC